MYQNPSLNSGDFPALPAAERKLTDYDRVVERLSENGVGEAETVRLISQLLPLRAKHSETFDHCLRVGLLAEAIGEFQHLDRKAMLYAGLLHDCGKALAPRELLEKREGWTPADSAAMEAHVMDGYHLLRGQFDLSAEILLWHHRFQPNAYPETLPEELHNYSNATLTMIQYMGRMVALADSYDALHRHNDRHGPLSGAEIKAKMLEHNPDQETLIRALYAAGIFDAAA